MLTAWIRQNKENCTGHIICEGDFEACGLIMSLSYLGIRLFTNKDVSHTNLIILIFNFVTLICVKNIKVKGKYNLFIT